MPDYGSKIADKAIDQTARKIRGVYKDAWFDIRKKMDDFTKRHIQKNAEMMKKLEAGEITKAEYDSWMRGQVFMGKQWDMKLDQIAKIMDNANKEAVGVVRNGSFNVFAENYNHTAYELEKRVGGAVNFNLYNEESVARLLKKNTKMLPEWKIDERKDYAWNRNKVENAITQGIIQGEGIDKITDRLADALITTNENRMRTFARTGITGAQNAGRQKQMQDAEDMGIKVKKRWVATLDSRTRDTHQELDGQEVPIDEPFVVDEMEIMYPGDPSAEPELVYNCRCAMIEIYEGIDRKSVRRDEDDNAVEDMTYKEWKEAKENGTLNTEKKLVEKPIFDESKEDIAAKAEALHTDSDLAQGTNDKEPKFIIPDEIRESINSETAADDWFEYENAQVMRSYIKDGEMPERMMLTGVSDEIPLERRQELAAEAELIQSTAEKTKTDQKVLYRGVVLSEEDIGNLQRGKEYQTETLTATTPDKKLASVYANPDNMGGEGLPVIIEFSKPDGLYGFVRGDGEEVVMPKNATFRIERKFVDEDGVTHISLYSKKGNNVRKQK